MKIFISATTSEFEACRDALASDLRAVGATEVKVQKDFQQGPRTLLEKLEAYISECDRVIVLVGSAFGAEPTPEEAPNGSPRRSYTQWEYFFAVGERLCGQRAKRKDIFVYFASEDFARLNTNSEDADTTRLQYTFAETILNSGEDRQLFSSLEQLRALVLRDGFRLPQSLVKPCNLPYASLGQLFKGRDGFLSDLHNRILNKLEADGRAKPVAITQTQRQAICGLGGIGKTRLAVEYALRFANDYSALLFVVADSPEHLKRGVGDLALVLDLKEVTSQQDEELRFKAALRWLMEHPGWCLILDNVDDESTATVCEDLVSKLYGGHVIITSRLNVWSMSGIESLDLDVLDASSARDILLERTPKRFKTNKDQQAAEELAKLLDGLALGLEQAGAFINTEQCSLPEYVELWRNGEPEVTDWFNPQVMKYPKSVAVTWNATVQRLGQASEGLLRLLSCFAAAPIPARVVTGSEVRKTIGKFLTIYDGQPEQPSARSLLTKLASFSMLKKLVDGPEQCLSMHRVVHDITWRRVPEEQRAALLEIAAELFDAIAPHEADRFENWAAWRGLCIHAECVWAAMEPYPKKHWNIRLMHGLALYHLGQGRFQEGEALQRRTYELMVERLGHENPDTLEAKNDLALLLSDRNEALKLLRESLEGLEVAYRKDNRPRTEIVLLASAYNVANYLHNYGEEGIEAEALLRRCSAGFSLSQEAGPNHWRTLLTNRQLAYLLWGTERTQEAEELARKTLSLSQENPELGPDHKDTLDSIRQVGKFLAAKGEDVEAEQYFRTELAGRERSPEIGPQHKSTMDSLYRLIETLWRLHKMLAAEELCISRCQQWCESIGAEHPNTVACKQLLVQILAWNGKIREARHTEVDLALALSHKHYYELQAKTGGENVELLQAMSSLARTLRDTGNLKEAESMYRRTLDGLKRCKGEADVDVAIELNNFGLLLRDQGKFDDSLKCYQEALEIDEKRRACSDPKHPKIPHRLNNISMVLLLLRKTDEAKIHLARAWALKESSHDVTSARILWVRLAVAMLTNEPIGVYLGQLKTFFATQVYRVSNQVDDYWNVQSVLANLQKYLSPDYVQLLAVIVDALNAGSHYHIEQQSANVAEPTANVIPTLSDLVFWRSQETIPLETQWQG